MNYQNTLTYLYNSVPMFQHVGGAAYKEGLENTQVLDKHFGHPHHSFRTIHVAGTNGKGSCSHTLAAILQEAGYRGGFILLLISVDFRERIRINGQPIPEKICSGFCRKRTGFLFEPLHPSFFELTTAMAFRYFADEKVDVAVIEVGLGGRLDCTNIIHPDLCIITNISFDHVQFLGDTLAKIAGEKAGIIKPGIPVVIGETTPETKPVFLQKAAAEKAPSYFAEDRMNNDYPKTENRVARTLPDKEHAHYPRRLAAVERSRLPDRRAKHTQRFCPCLRTDRTNGTMAETAGCPPTLICDTGHNVGGITYIVEQLKQQTYRQLHIIIGMVNDKDISGVLSLLPKDAVYYFTKASVKRALPEEEAVQARCQSRLAGKLLSGCSCRCDRRTRKKPPRKISSS